MEYRVLGPLEVLDPSGRKLPLGGAMQQSVLASLLLRAGQTVALDRLVDDTWEKPPATAPRTLQAYISRLRHELPNGVIETRPGGYRFNIGGDELDLKTFERRAAQGHAELGAGECERAAPLLREALALWRGPALAGLSSTALQREAERLEELRLSVLEDRVDADLGRGRHGESVPELTALVAEHPLRERLRAQLMRALYGSGRPGDALALYREGRRLLVEELGMEPGQELRELEQAILRQDAELDGHEPKRPVIATEPATSSPGPPVGHPQREVRKVVTILFCDVVGSTGHAESTDPEVVRALLARYFERMKTIVGRHGGTVEKFIGDAVLAVFGVPIAHEDDALRACRAALEMRESFSELGIEGRIGITTGEVVTGTEERLVTGDPVNVAARLQQAAEAGAVLIGRPTLQLVREATQVEALEPLALKGKSQRVEAYRLLAVHDAPLRRDELRFVGRAQELAAIEEAWRRALAARCCELLTIVGEAGVGKSRLVREALAAVDTRVVEGRCLPYGEGITYWPVVEVMKQLDTLPSDAAAAAATGSLLGETKEATSAEEIAWGFRKLLEEQAPLIVVFDDVQWGEETFLDLLEHVALLSSGAPILLLAMARPELTEQRAEWPVTLRLEPLSAAEAEELVPEHVSRELRTRIADAAGGNPLFVEEMVAVAGEAGGEIVVPPTLQALVATRLDQLDPAERSLLERGAVEGEVFHRGAVHALAPDERQVTPRLASLVRKGLIRPVKPQLVGEDGFRFHHLLIRDAAYAGLPKATRADLHESFAAWLKDRGAELVEQEELVGYHLEQACNYRRALGLADDRELTAAARSHLAASARRALSRQDFGAAANLFERAAALAPPAEVDVQLELSYVIALAWRGQAREAFRHAGSVAERAAAAGDRFGELCARLEEAVQRVFAEPEGATEPLVALVEQALPVLEATGDDFALHRGYRALGEVKGFHGHADAAAEAFQRAAAHAQRAGFPNETLVALSNLERFVGTTRLSELLAWQDTQDEGARRNPWLRSIRAQALAMLGRPDEARAILAALRLELDDRGGGILAIVSRSAALRVELLAGDPAAALQPAEELCRLYEELGHQAFLSWGAAMLAQVYYALGRLEDADAWAERAAAVVASDDPDTLWRQVRAKVLARRGEHAKAERLARQATDISDTTEWLGAQADAYTDLAEVLALGGNSEAATEALEQALARYERKENLAMADRVRARLDELQSSEPVAPRP